MIFFADRDLGSLFPQILSDAGIHVERHDDHFPNNTPDDIWLQATDAGCHSVWTTASSLPRIDHLVEVDPKDSGVAEQERGAHEQQRARYEVDGGGFEAEQQHGDDDGQGRG